MTPVVNILIIEDKDEKYRRVQSLVRKKIRPIKCNIDHVQTHLAATKALENKNYDLVILDLLLPAINEKEKPEIQNSISLLQGIIDGEFSMPRHVVGLTEFPEKIQEAQDVFDKNLHALVAFDWVKEDWADQICNKITQLIKGREAALSFLRESYGTDIVILTARYENEYKPIYSEIDWKSKPIQLTSLGSSVEAVIGQAKIGSSKSKSVALICLMDMGIAAASAITTQCCITLRPRLLVMLGMCCGFKDTDCQKPALLGDVIVARETTCWQEGKFVGTEEKTGEKKKWLSRSNPLKISEDISLLVSKFIEKNKSEVRVAMKSYVDRPEIKEKVEKYKDNFRSNPALNYGMLTTGSSLVADEEQISEILRRLPSCLGLDMEATGIYTAVKKSYGATASVFLIKGVADFGNTGKKGDDYDDAQPIASVLSYIVFEKIVSALPIFK